jgi:phage RecT family recombinase
MRKSGHDLVVINQAFDDRALPSRFNGNRFDKDMRWAAEKEYAIQVISKSRTLQECTPESIRTSLLEVAWSGMSLAPSMAHAYLIPYEDRANQVVECTFKPGYRGLAYMSMKGGAVTAIQAARVFALDQFRVYTQNNRRIVDHEENHQVSNRGVLTNVWSIAQLASGGEQIEITPADVIEAAKQQAFKAGAKGGMVWRGPFVDQMQLKVSIRRLLKLIPSDPAGWLRHGLEVVSKHDDVDFDKVPPSAPGSQELVVSEDQVLQLHAVLTDRGFSSAKAENWLTNAANAYGCKNIRDLPARHFDDAKVRLVARADKAAERS